MSRWIDYDAIDYRNDRLHDKSEKFMNGVIYMAQRIEKIPSIDIVRCQECKWNENTCINHGEMKPRCKFTDYVHTADDFCSYGERNSSEKPNNSMERSSE